MVCRWLVCRDLDCCHLIGWFKYPWPSLLLCDWTLFLFQEGDDLVKDSGFSATAVLQKGKKVHLTHHLISDTSKKKRLQKELEDVAIYRMLA